MNEYKDGILCSPIEKTCHSSLPGQADYTVSLTAVEVRTAQAAEHWWGSQKDDSSAFVLIWTPTPEEFPLSVCVCVLGMYLLGCVQTQLMCKVWRVQICAYCEATKKNGLLLCSWCGAPHKISLCFQVYGIISLLMHMLTGKWIRQFTFLQQSLFSSLCADVLELKI